MSTSQQLFWYAALFCAAIACDSTTDQADALRQFDVRSAVTVQASDDRRSMLFDAREQLVERCMAAQGFDYRPARYQPPLELPPLFGTDDVETAQSIGYPFLAEDRSGSGETTDALEQVSSRTVEFLLALAGSESDYVSVGDGSLAVPGAGCIVEALRVLFDDPVEYQYAESIEANLWSLAMNEVLVEPSVLTATSAYVSCMADRGFTQFADPVDAVSFAAQEWAQGRYTESEVRVVALADAECNRSTRLRATAQPLYEQQLVVVSEQYAGLIERLDEWRTSAISRIDIE